MKNLIILVLAFGFGSISAQDAATYQRPPQAIADLVEAPSTPGVLFSPDKAWMFFLER
jgi:hypothetical protein